MCVLFVPAEDHTAFTVQKPVVAVKEQVAVRTARHITQKRCKPLLRAYCQSLCGTTAIAQQAAMCQCLAFRRDDQKFDGVVLARLEPSRRLNFQLIVVCLTL